MSEKLKVEDVVTGEVYETVQHPTNKDLLKITGGLLKGDSLHKGRVRIIERQTVQNSKSEEEITRPNHYHKSGLDPIEVMKRIFTKEELRGFYRGNILKYSMRYQDKGGRDDLIKLRDYTNMLIELEGE